MNRRYEYNFYQLLQRLKREINLRSLNLGGSSGTNGGTGGPPGGFIGYLPQTRVAYDYTEAASSGIPSSGASVLDNLNHIRYRLDALEDGEVSGQITIQENDAVVASGVTVLNFEGSVAVVSNGGGKATVTVTASGTGSGSGASTLNDLTDVTITTPASGQYLKYNGSQWVNSAAPTSSGSVPALDANRVVITDAGGTLSTSASLNVANNNNGYPSIVMGGDNDFGLAWDSSYELNLVRRSPGIDPLAIWGFYSAPKIDLFLSDSAFDSLGAVQANSVLGQFIFWGYEPNSEYVDTALIQAKALETFSEDTGWGTSLEFWTAPASGWLKAKALDLRATLATFNGDLQIPVNRGYYLGGLTSDNSWRIVPSGVYLTFQKRESGVWNVKDTVPSSGVVSSGGGASYLDDLLDVNTSVAVSGVYLYYDGAEWLPSGINPITDWMAFPGVFALEFASATPPIYTMRKTGNYTGVITSGMRVRLVQPGGTKYFTVVSATYSSFSLKTTFTLYGGTSYTLDNDTISNAYYSQAFAPTGFPYELMTWTRLADLGSLAVPSGYVLVADGNGYTHWQEMTATSSGSSPTTATIVFGFNAGASALTAPQYTELSLPFAGTINSWTILADQSGTATIDLWKDTYANYPPTVGDSICGGNYITLSGAKNQDSTLTGWNKTITAGDVLKVNLSSVSAVTRVTVTITYTRS